MLSHLNCLASLYVGSRLYMVLAGVTFWSVTNPLTIFKVCFLECVTSWNPKHFAASMYHCHHVFLATSRTRQSRPSPYCLAITTFSGCDERCVVVATAIFMDRCSCRQKVRRLRLRRRFADPLSTNNLKSTSCSLTSWHSTSPSSLKRLICTRRGTACVLCHSGIALCSSGLGHSLRYYLVPGKDASMKCFEAVLGKVHLPCLRFIVVRNGPGVVFWHPFSLSVSEACILVI